MAPNDGVRAGRREGCSWKYALHQERRSRARCAVSKRPRKKPVSSPRLASTSTTKNLASDAKRNPPPPGNAERKNSPKASPARRLLDLGTNNNGSQRPD